MSKQNMVVANGDRSTQRIEHGMLVEYSNAARPLILHFEFNPTSISRTRSVTVRTGGAPGTKGGYDFQNKSEVVRASQGVSVNAESFSIKILLDATDRMNAGDSTASIEGIQPELDTIRSMLEPKSQNQEGARTLAALGKGSERAFSRHQFASVFEFRWGKQSIPVFITQIQLEVKSYLPSLCPYRAEANLSLQVIESNNPVYTRELERQFRSAEQNIGAAQNFSVAGKYQGVR